MTKYQSRSARLGSVVDNLNDLQADCESLCSDIQTAVEELDEQKKNLSKEDAEEFRERANNLEADTSEVQSLADEMGSWRDGLSGTNLENSNKYQMIDEACNTLEGVDSEINAPSPPDGLDKDEWGSYADELEDTARQSEDMASELEGVEFPGMYS